MKIKRIDLPLDKPQQFYELMENLNKKIFTLNDIGISARVHNSWRSAELIPNAEQDGKWASYDFIQYIWLRMVKDLRKFGLPLEVIYQIKKYLFKGLDKGPNVDTGRIEAFFKNYFEQRHGVTIPGALYSEENVATGLALVQNLFRGFVFNHLYYRSNTSFYIYLDGYVAIWSDMHEQTYPEHRPDTNEPHIVLPIAHYVMDFLNDETKAEFLNTVPILTYEEKEVLQAMRNHQLKELTVKFIQDGKSRKIDIITKADGELTEEQTKQITRILSLGNYQNISLKKHNGSKLYFEHEKRQKL